MNFALTNWKDVICVKKSIWKLLAMKHCMSPYHGNHDDIALLTHLIESENLPSGDDVINRLNSYS